MKIKYGYIPHIRVHFSSLQFLPYTKSHNGSHPCQVHSSSYGTQWSSTQLILVLLSFKSQFDLPCSRKPGLGQVHLALWSLSSTFSDYLPYYMPSSFTCLIAGLKHWVGIRPSGLVFYDPVQSRESLNGKRLFFKLKFNISGHQIQM